jgi:hypothetical protein
MSEGKKYYVTFELHKLIKRCVECPIYFYDLNCHQKVASNDKPGQHKSCCLKSQVEAIPQDKGE